MSPDNSQELDRENIIRLLNQLGNDNDEEVVTSARALHAQISGANADWNNLLVGQDGPEPESEEEAQPEEDNTPENSKSEETLSDSDATKILDKLLSNSDISEYLKEELEDYKVDIAEGELENSDRSYLIALNKRLS